MQELKQSESAYFVTLTYADEHLPEGANLSKRDVQLFLKRLKIAQERLVPKNLNKEQKTRWKKAWKVRYYLGAEYGDKMDRPHYHIIVFNLKRKWITELVDYVDKETGEIKKQCLELEKLWRYGNVFVGDVTQASIHYTTGYIMQKQSTGKEVKPFSLMSKRPPLGINYLTEEVKKYHKENENITITFEGGFKQAIPRIYKKKIFTENEKVQNRIDATRIIHEKDKKLKAKYKTKKRSKEEAVKHYKQWKQKQKLKSKHYG